MIVTTPSSHYDDSYCLAYAQSHEGYVVSNDKFGDQKKPGMKEWVRAHTVG